MSKQSVWTVFKAKDQISTAFKAMARNSKRFGNTAEDAFKKASKGAGFFDNVTKGILKANLVGKGLQVAQMGVSALATEFISFDDSVVSASAKFKGLDLTTQNGIKTMEKLRLAARKTGSETKFSATEAAGGLEFLAMAGFNAEQAMSALPGVTSLATVAQTDLARATDIASDSLGAFGLMTNDNIQLQKNLTRVNDVMAKTMTSTNTSIEDMFEAIKKGAPDFTSAGQSMETFSAMLGIMANSGVKGSEAGTKLRNIMVRLAKPTKEAQEFIDKLGIKTQDANGNFRDAMDILADVEKGTAKLGSAQKAAALSTIFGARNQGAINILLKEGTKNVRAFRKTLLGATGASDKMAKVIEKSLGNKIKALQSALIEMGFKAVGVFRGDMAESLDLLTMKIRNFDVTPIIEGVKLAFQIMKDLAVVMKAAIIVLGIWGAKLLLIKAKVIAVVAASKALSFIIGAIGLAFKVAAFLATASVGAIAAAIAAVIAAVVLLWKYWDQVSSFMIKTGNAIWNLFKNIGKAIGGIIKGAVKLTGSLFEDDEIKAISEQSNDDFSGVLAPNKTDEEAKKFQFDARLKFLNAPENLEVEKTSFSGAPMMIEGIGAN